VIRSEAGMPVRRFCRRLGIPPSTWYDWRAAHDAGRPRKVWPAPVVDEIAAPAAQQAHKWSAWGHRKIWAMMRADGVTASQSSVYRALHRQGLLQPARYHAERRALAEARKKAFVEPPTRRNRVWQMDFTRIEIASGSVWWISPVVDYATKVVLAAPVSTRTAARDALTALQAGIDEAEALLGRPLLEDCLDPTTGELHPVILVTDNGPCYKSADFVRFIAGRSELRHVRTRHYAPQTNGVVERFNQSLKYEHLYRLEIGDGQALVEEIETFRTIYNTIRPHETLDWSRPLDAYLNQPTSYALSEPESVRES
jgi:transposase InsO family protein